MAPKILLVPAILAMCTLPACTQGVDNVLRARSEARLSHLESTPVTQGACDSLGQYIAKDVASERVAARGQEMQADYLVLR
jgi:hypothetical protein